MTSDEPRTRAVSRRSRDAPDPRLTSLFGQLGEVIADLGTPDFPPALARLLEQAGGYGSTVVTAFSGTSRPVRLFSNLPASEEETTLQPYFDGTYLLDPWFNMAVSETGDGVFRFAECVPDGFRKSDYFLSYYSKTGLIDECGIFVRLSPQICIVVMLGIRAGDGTPRARGKLKELHAIFPAVRELIARHWASLATIPVNALDNLQTMCKARGLVGREIEVTGQLLRGFSNKMIGRELGISHETVKVYRKRINRKLGTRSTREIYSIFFGKSF